MKGALFAFAFVGAFVSAVYGQAPVVLYDPATTADNAPKFTAKDESVVKTKLVPKALERWPDDESCSGGDLNIVGAVAGSFTRKGAAQRAIVYELCQTGNGFANNGIAVVENGAVAAHFTYEGGWNLNLKRVPDINANGLDELVIEIGGGLHQGYTGSSIMIVEVLPTAVKELGSYLVFTNECDIYVEEKYCDRSYKLTVTPGARPAFVSQKYENRGSDARPRWVATGKPLRAKPVGDDEPYNYSRAQ